MECGIKSRENTRDTTDQSHAAQDGQAVDNLQSEVDKRSEDDDKVKDIPSVAEEIRAQGSHFQDTLGREDGSENLTNNAVVNNDDGRHSNERLMTGSPLICRHSTHCH